MHASTSSAMPSLPLCGRSEEYRVLRSGLDRALSGDSVSFLLTGTEGMGKSRLARALMDEGERKGFLVSAAAGYAMESEVPYSIFCDLLDPLVGDQSPEGLLSFTRGAPEFQFVCPSLALIDHEATRSGDAIPDLRNRLLWNFPRFLDRLRRDQPLLLVIEDFEWADPSSRELVHFLGRHHLDVPMVMLCTVDPDGSTAGPAALEAATSGADRPGARTLELGPLAADHVVELVSKGFRVDPEVVREFGEGLHRWTGGNPLFVSEVLANLVSKGRIRREGGSWVGWSLKEIEPPRSVRDLVLRRLEGLSAEARAAADFAAVVGSRSRFDLLAHAVGMPEERLLHAAEELVEKQVLEEEVEGTSIYYAFAHPVVREVLYSAIGGARLRKMHAEVAKALERLYGDRAIEHAEALATHVAHAGDAVEPARAAAYLANAGRLALSAHADREAARNLEQALELLPGEEGEEADRERAQLIEELARSYQRLGRYQDATRLLQSARQMIEAPAGRDLAALDRRLGLAAFWAGRPDDAMEHWNRGLDVARAAGSPLIEARLRLARSACLQEIARPAEAREEAEAALRLGEELGDVQIQVSAHLNLILLHTWMGPTEEAQPHGEAAIRLAKASGRRAEQMAAHWAMAVLEGLRGNPEPTRAHLDQAGALADQLGSPLLSLRLAEVEIEYAARMGEWDRGTDLAAESIRMARDLNQPLNLSRLLIVSGMLHLGRGDIERAREEIDEAWELAGASESIEPTTTHTAILAFTGRAALHLAAEEHAEAIRVAEEGLDLVDRNGYTAWAVLRLLPTIAEASLILRDFERAERVHDRFQKEAARYQHPYARAWAQILEALLIWLRGDSAGGAEAMERGVELLEKIGLVPDAARLRRQWAGRLAEIGDREGAVRELRRSHDVLSGLGAEPELEKARKQFRDVGARPPSRRTAPGTGILTAREAEIARLVGERKSNKAIAKELGISPRTVGTHLSSIFKKLETTSRAQLGDLVRDGMLGN